MGDKLQVVGIPARVAAAAMVELSALWDGTAKELPAEPVGVTVLGLGDTPVWRGHSSEQPAGSVLGMRWGCVGPRTVRSIRRSSSERRLAGCGRSAGWFM